jgi:hypothetical protein
MKPFGFRGLLFFNMDKEPSIINTTGYRTKERI